MRARTFLRAGLWVALALFVQACKSKGDSAEAEPSKGASPKKPTPSAKPAPSGPRALRDSRCALAGSPSDIVTGDAGGYAHAIAASNKGVLVTWLEKRDGSSGFGPEGSREVVELARLYAPDLTPSGAPRVLGTQGSIDAFANGAAPVAFADGGLSAAHCEWAAFAGKLDCGLEPMVGKHAMTMKSEVGGPGPTRDRFAVAPYAGGAAILLPSGISLDLIRTRDKAANVLTERENEEAVVTPAAAAGPSDDEILAAWRWKDAGKQSMHVARVRAKSSDTIVKLDVHGELGAPSIAWTGDRAVLAFAVRLRATDPYGIQWVEWNTKSDPTLSVLDVGAEPAMAPSVAPADAPDCVMLAWVSGRGKATSSHGGIVCGGQLVKATAFDISKAGIEAGDVEIARAPNGAAYALWQELPKGQPAELRLAKIECK